MVTNATSFLVKKLGLLQPPTRSAAICCAGVGGAEDEEAGDVESGGARDEGGTCWRNKRSSGRRGRGGDRTVGSRPAAAVLII